MDDLGLYARLATGTLGAADVAALERAAEEPLAARAPLLGVLDAALAHSSPELRRAALQALAGADGRRAFAAEMAAFMDADPEVGVAAVEAFRASAAHQPLRWVHALFHPELEVRRRALASAAPAGADELEVFLLSDPPVRDELLARPRLAPGPDALPLLVELAGRGELDADRALELLEALEPRRVLEVAASGAARSGELARALLAALELPADPERDGLDLLFELARRATIDARASFVAFLEPALDAAGPLETRVAASLFVVCASVPAPPPELVRLLVSAHPPALAWKHLPLQVRRAAALALGTHVVKKLERESVRAFLVELAPPGSELEPALVAALLCLVEDRPLSLAVEIYGLDALVEAFGRAPLRAAPLLSIPDDSKRGRNWLLAEIAKRGEVSQGTLHALSAWVLPIVRLDFVDALEPQAALGMALALAALFDEPAVIFKPNRVSRLAIALSARMTDSVSADLQRRLLTRLLADMVRRGDASRSSFALSLLGELGQRMDVEIFASAFPALGDERLVAALPLLSAATRVPFGKELHLAASLTEHPSPEVRKWALERAPSAPRPKPVVPAPSGAVSELGAARVAHLARASAADLDAAAESLVGVVHTGFVEALSRRPRPSPSLAVCLALLSAGDDAVAVARELERYKSDDPAFLSALDVRAVGALSTQRELPLLGASWLYRWERQAFRVGEIALASAGRAFGLLDLGRSLPSALCREHVASALGRVFQLWAARDRDKLAAAVPEARPVAELAITLLAGETGEGAAEILVALDAARFGVVRELADAISHALPDASATVRRRLDKIASGKGLAPSGPSLAPRRELDAAERAEIRGLDDLEALRSLGGDVDAARVEEASLRLVELGPPGLEVLAALVLAAPPAPRARVVIDTLPLWPEGAALERVTGALERLGPELRFRVALALVERGRMVELETALAAACAEGRESWFRHDDWQRLLARLPLETLARRLAVSPQPHAYRRAVEALLAEPVEATRRAALRAFLAAGTERLAELRLKVAEALHAEGDDFGFPLRLAHALEGGTLSEALFSRLGDVHVERAVAAVLFAGARGGLEARLCDLLEGRGTPRAARGQAYERLLVESTALDTAKKASGRLMRFEARSEKIRRIARVFVWGARVAPVISGRRLRVHMTDGRALGYTRLEGTKVYVTALPILRGERGARAVVEGLVLHEIGHHRCHRGPGAAEVWKRATKDKLFGVLNLVADEHLERNLRALDSGYGDRLKQLAAYAFQHSDREVPVRSLLRVLGPNAFGVLSRAGLELAYAKDAVRVQSGALLAEMERVGSSFARFVRALRMGLGNRHADPKVAEALGMFDRRFRHASMPELLAIARKLRSIFGWEAAFADDIGGHETGANAERDNAISGDGIGDEEVQREVERVTDPGKMSGSSGGSGRPGKLWINVSGVADFERIHDVQPLPRDAAAHRELARELTRHSRRLRAYLSELGLSRVPERRRLRGTRVDSHDLRNLVLRGDPRVLVRRETLFDTDLFIGVAVDCSGSMQTGHSMDKAKRFAVLLAEAARGLSGVDLRVFGFTDRVIYDAGDAARSAATSLAANGGNNDAAGLLHVAEVAKKSPRSARLLVMVSDGLPTECSVEALRGLVERLERREGMCVAQVAVQPLEEVCFKHFVLLNEDDMDRAVAGFGRTLVKLVRRAIS